MIMAFLDWDEAGPDPGAAAADPRRRLSRRESRRGSADNIGIGLDVVSRGGGENRPVRRGLSKEKRQAMMVAESAMAAEEDDSDWKPEIVPKSPDEVTRIRAPVRANFLFQHLNEQQAQQVYNVMKRVPVKKGEVVIRQVDAGEFSVTLNQGGKQVEILKYTTSGNTNPCFG